MADMARMGKAVAYVCLPEDVLSGMAARENLLEDGAGGGDVESELDLELAVAASEIAEALVETGRALGHLHILRLSLEALAYRRGYTEGAKTVATICNAVARDCPARGSEKR